MTERLAAEAFRDVRRVGRALVVAWPRLPASRLGPLGSALVERGRQEGLRVRLFGLSPAPLRREGLGVLPIGREPLWRPQSWLLRAERRTSLRAQVRRAEGKGLRLQWWSGEQAPPEAWALAARWLRSRGMAPMDFCVRVRLGGGPLLLGRREGRLVALAQVRPLHEWDGWLVEHLMRDPEAAPNGWAEAMLLEVARRAEQEGRAWVSLGLAPLDGPGVPTWMRAAGRLGRPLFDFEGLAAFKGRLHPDRWVRRVVGHDAGELAPRVMLDVLRAFAGGSLLGFGLRTLGHRLGRGPAPLGLPSAPNPGALLVLPESRPSEPPRSPR